MANLYTVCTVCLLIEVVLSVPAIITGPSDVAVKVGDTRVKLTCQARLEGIDALVWTNAAGRNVYNSVEGVLPVYKTLYDIEKIVSPPTEYHNLIIKQGKITDGNEMSCRLAIGASAKVGQLVVMEPPRLSLRDMEEGKTTIEECKLDYGAVAEAESNPGMLPKMELSVEGRTVAAQEKRLAGRPGSTPHTLTMSVNYAARSEDNGKKITCRAYTTIPAYNLSSSGIMNVQFAARTPVVTPKDKYIFAVGESLYCTSEGNPSPSVYWKRIPPPGSRSTGVLTVMKKMMGSNKWECSAYNARNKNPMKVTVNFTVVS